jgi:hypothetical protein
MARINRTGKAWRRAAVADSRESVARRMPKTPSDYYQRSLEACRRAWTTGRNIGALDEAARLSEQAGAGIAPYWLVQALIDILMKRDGRSFSKMRGRFHRDMIDYARAEFFEEARDHGYTHEAAAALASRYFAGTPARGSAEAMRKSHQKVRRHASREPGRYFIGEQADRLVTTLLPRTPPELISVRREK